MKPRSILCIGILSWAVQFAQLTQATPIPLRVFPSPAAMSQHAATIFQAEAQATAAKDQCLLVVVPTGGTPEGMYRELVQLHQKGTLPMSHVYLFNMDEYVGLGKDHPQSYHTYMRARFIDHIARDSVHTQFDFYRNHWYIAHGDAPDPVIEAERLRKQFNTSRKQLSTRTIVFAGIGTDPAHIAFNDFPQEPVPFHNKSLTEEEKNAHALQSTFRMVPLAEGTRRANARYFENDITKVPSHAITIGFQEILSADRIIVLATGESKIQALYRTFAEEPTYQVPASLLRTQSEKVEFLLDEVAFGIGAAGEENLAQQCNKPEFHKKVRMDNHQTSLSLEALARSNQVALLETREVSIEGVHRITLPTGKRILYISQFPYQEPSILPLLRKRNHLDSVSLAEIEKKYGLTAYIEQEKDLGMPYGYDVILLPDTPEMARLDNTIPESIRIRYEVPGHAGKKRVILTPAMLETKKQALRLHHSQIARTAYDRIIEEMARTDDPKEPFGEFQFVPSSYIRLTAATHTIMIAPHPDDVEIGLGGMLQRWSAEETSITVINATSGYRAKMYREDFTPYLASYTAARRDRIEALPPGEITDPETKKWIRAMESESAIAVLHPPAKVIHADLPFYTAPDYTLTDADRVRVAELLPMLAPHESLQLYLSDPLDQHGAHRATTALFEERVKYLQDQGATVTVSYYETPWTGNWNLFHYVPDHGSKLGALVGLEQLAGKGHKSLDPDQMASDTAQRYRVERPKKE